MGLDADFSFARFQAALCVVYCLPFCCVGFWWASELPTLRFFQAVFWFATAYPIGSLKICSHQMQFRFHQATIVRMHVKREAEF